ncbi:MAG: hypothetical protein V3S52_09410 [Gemmatimonadota bacterium]
MMRDHIPSMRAGMLAVLIVAPTACGSNPVEPTVEARLFGTWEWVEAEGGIAGSVITPETEGFTMRLVITRPNHIELFRDGVSERVASFELLPAQDLVDEFVSPRLRYSDPIFGFEEQEVGFDVEGRLVLTDPCCDGFAYTWTRVNGDG